MKSNIQIFRDVNEDRMKLVFLGMSIKPMQMISWLCEMRIDTRYNEIIEINVYNAIGSHSEPVGYKILDTSEWPGNNYKVSWTIALVAALHNIVPHTVTRAMYDRIVHDPQYKDTPSIFPYTGKPIEFQVLI